MSAIKNDQNSSFLIPHFADGRPPHSARRAVETRRVRGNQGHHQVHGQQDAQVAVLASAAAGSNPPIHPNGPRQDQQSCLISVLSHSFVH